MDIAVWHQCTNSTLPSSLHYFNLFGNCSWEDAQALPTQWILTTLPAFAGGFTKAVH